MTRLGFCTKNCGFIDCLTDRVKVSILSGALLALDNVNRFYCL